MFFKLHYNKVLFLFILLLALFFHFDSMNEYPMYIHAWAQADRFALALNFLWNDFNLFQAETYLMNLQFPDVFMHAKGDSITMVNLPFHEYFIAFFMKLFNTTEPIVFRLYQLTWSIVGLMFLLKIAKRLQLTIINRSILILFIATTPLFVYYQNNYLPSISSIRLCIVAVFFYIKYYDSKQTAYLYLSLLLFLFAGLYRNTFVIQLIAILGLEFIRVIKRNAKLIPLLLSTIVLGLVFYLQNRFQMQQVEQYGSVFQYYLTPPKNWDHVVSITNRILDRWILEYFSISHYLFLSVLIISFIFFRIVKKYIRPEKRIVNITVIYPIGALFGCFLFYLVMYPKLFDHDYYIMDTLYLPIVLLVLFLLRYLQEILSKSILIGLLIVFSIPSIILAKNNLNERRAERFWDYSPKTVADLLQVEETLDSLNIDKSKKILMIGSNYPNLPFILMNRKGFIVNSSNNQFIEKALQWDYDFILIHDHVYKEKYHSHYPELLGKVKKVYSNGLYTICKLEEQTETPSLATFFSLKQNKLIYHQTLNFETLEVDDGWKNMNRTNETSYLGDFSNFVKAENLFGLTFQTKQLLLNQNDNHLVQVNMHIKSPKTLRNFNMVVSINESKGRTFYQATNLKELYNNLNEWQEINLQYIIPPIKEDQAKLSLYFWNPGKQDAYVDEFSLSIY